MPGYATKAMRAALAAAVAACVLSLGTACSKAAPADGSGGTDMEVDVLVRGAEPGGMTDAWEAPGGMPSLALRDDGTATWRDGTGEYDCPWLMSGPADGEVMLSDGRALRLSFDAGTDVLTVIEMEDGLDGPETPMARVGGTR